MKDPSDYSLDEVCLFLNAIDLGSKADNFRENAVDGGMLVMLGPEDYGELGLTSLQGKKILKSVEFATELAKSGSSGGGVDSAKLDALTQEIAELRGENAALKAQLKEYTSAQARSAPAPAPAPRPTAPSAHYYRQEPVGHPVLREGARGAARGAILGAVAGAIAGDAGEGAKIGAAVGGTAGGMRGLGQRRRARLRGGGGGGLFFD